MRMSWMRWCSVGILTATLAGCGGPAPDEVLREFAASIVKRDAKTYFHHSHLDRKSRRSMDENPEVAQALFEKAIDEDGVSIAKLILASDLKVIGESDFSRTIRITPKDPRKRKEMADEGFKGFTLKAFNQDGEWKIKFETIAPIPMR